MNFAFSPSIDHHGFVEKRQFFLCPAPEDNVCGQLFFVCGSTIASETRDPFRVAGFLFAALTIHEGVLNLRHWQTTRRLCECECVCVCVKMGDTLDFGRLPFAEMNMFINQAPACCRRPSAH